METLFKEVKQKKVSEEISEQIKRLIIQGRLKPGERMPSERELAEMMNVGRSSVREAINKLETLGFIEIRKRKGNFIKGLNSTISFNPLKQLVTSDRRNISYFYEIRHDIELAAAYTAAKNRTDEDLQQINKCLADKKSGLSWEVDFAFHIVVAQATHNFLRVHVIKDIFDFTSEFTQSIWVKILEDKTNFSTMIEQHESIYHAIRQQDAEKARNLMDEHLTWGNRKVESNFK